MNLYSVYDVQTGQYIREKVKKESIEKLFDFPKCYIYSAERRGSIVRGRYRIEKHLNQTEVSRCGEEKWLMEEWDRVTEKAREFYRVKKYGETLHEGTTARTD